MDIGNHLQKEQGEKARFNNVYLIDDFTASGTTFIRCVEGEWKGKLQKFNSLLCNARGELRDEFPISNEYTLHIHHHVSTQQARQTLECRVLEACEKWAECSFDRVEITEGMRLPHGLKMTVGALEVTDEESEVWCEAVLATSVTDTCGSGDMVSIGLIDPLASAGEALS